MNTKLVIRVLALVFVLGLGTLSAFAEDESGYIDDYAGGSPIQISVADYTQQANYFAQQYPDMAPQLNANIANLNSQGFGPQDMVTMGGGGFQGNDFSDARGMLASSGRTSLPPVSRVQRDPESQLKIDAGAKILNDEMIARKGGTTVPLTSTEQKAVASQPIEGLKGPDFWAKQTEQTNKEITFEKAIAKELWAQNADLRDNNLSGENLSGKMIEHDTELAKLHQGRASIESGADAQWNRNMASNMTAKIGDDSVNIDYTHLAAAWASGEVVTGAGDDGETSARGTRSRTGSGGNSPTQTSTTPTSPAEQTKIRGRTFFDDENPSAGAPKLSYPSQQPAPVMPAADATSETIRQFVNPGTSLQQQPAPVMPAADATSETIRQFTDPTNSAKTSPEGSSILNKVGNALTWPFEGTWASWPFGSKDTTVGQPPAPAAPGPLDGNVIPQFGEKNSPILPKAM